MDARRAPHHEGECRHVKADGVRVPDIGHGTALSIGHRRTSWQTRNATREATKPTTSEPTTRETSVSGVLERALQRIPRTRCDDLLHQEEQTLVHRRADGTQTAVELVVTQAVFARNPCATTAAENPKAATGEATDAATEATS